MRHNAGRASFLPDDYVARRAEQRANFVSLTLFVVVMFCVISAYFVTNRQWIKLRAEQDAINVEYEHEAVRIEQHKQLDELKRQMMAKAEITAALIEKVPRSVLLAEIVTRMPEELTLMELQLASKRIEPPRPAPKATDNQPVKRIRTLVSPGQDETPQPAQPAVQAPTFEFKLVLVGVASSNNDVGDYLEALRECELLHHVELQYIKDTVINEMDLRKFEIQAVLRPDADARSIESVEELRLAAPGEKRRDVTGVPSEGEDK